MRHKPYTKAYAKYGLSPSPTQTTVTTNFSCRIPHIKPLGPCRRQRYLQPKHQHRHGHGNSHIFINGSVSPQTQQYKTH
jgi:hypothetical protein